MSERAPGTEGVNEIDHHSVDSLFTALMACSRAAKAYRGHGDAHWHLEPSIVRNQRYLYQKDHLGLDRERGSVPLENHFLRLFVSACDKAGLGVSGDSEKLRNFLDDPDAINAPEAQGTGRQEPTQWPGDSNEMLSLMAQAQHYGVPTRLLDWTTAPLIAAYFAASAALKEWAGRRSCQQLGRQLSVWELNIDESNRDRRDFEIKRAPGSVSTHLPAQRGIFTLLKGVSIPSLRLEDHADASRFLTKHNLPIRLIPELMRECDRHGHSAATLFPRYEGAARHAEEIFLISELSEQIKASEQQRDPGGDMEHSRP